MAIAGYKLRINGGSLSDQVVDVGNVLTYTFTGLDPSTEYAIEVASYDDLGTDSIWSAPVLATTEAAPMLKLVVNAEGKVIVGASGRPQVILV